MILIPTVIDYIKSNLEQFIPSICNVPYVLYDEFTSAWESTPYQCVLIQRRAEVQRRRSADHDNHASFYIDDARTIVIDILETHASFCGLALSTDFKNGVFIPGSLDFYRSGSRAAILVHYNDPDSLRHISTILEGLLSVIFRKVTWYFNP